jgi:hypothetical protein
VPPHSFYRRDKQSQAEELNACPYPNEATFWMEYFPVKVSFVRFVLTVIPDFKAPLSTTPPPTGRARWLVFALTVKLAMETSYGVRCTMEGMP